MSGQLSTRIALLEAMPLEGLRQEWLDRIGPPPRLRSVDLLRRMLAWRLQAQVLGELPEETQKALRGRALPSRGPRITPGMRLVREFKGERHEVTVLADGVRYRGETFASLSEAARAITGVRWNGPRFFGLRGGS